MGRTYQFGRRILRLQLLLTMEKLELRAFKSCRVAKPEKPPRFASSHSLLPLIDETQPGSVTKIETKTLAGHCYHMLSRICQIQPKRLFLPDESFLERNGLMKCVKTACCPSLTINGLWLLNAWMLKFERRLLRSKQLQKCRFVYLQSCSQRSNTSHICLHSLIGLAAEVLGGKAE